MKKFVSLLIMLSILFITYADPVQAESPYDSELYYNAVYDDTDDFYISQEEFLSLEHTSDVYPMLSESGYIVSSNLAIAKYSSTQLYINGFTVGSASVTKCGFTVVTVQRKKSTSNTWNTYKTYVNMLSDTSSYTLGKLVDVGTGYQYRVRAIHYAAKTPNEYTTLTGTTSSLSF